MNDINNFKGKAEAGDLGTGDSVQLKKVEKLLEEYVSKDLSRIYRLAILSCKEMERSHIHTYDKKNS